MSRPLPIAPEFALFLMESPESAGTGPVFRLEGRRGRYREWRVSEIVSKIGKAEAAWAAYEQTTLAVFFRAVT